MYLTRRSLSLVLVAATTLALAPALAACKKNDSAIPVGAYLSLSGSDAAFGGDTRDGIELALLETNAAGGVKGKKIRIIYEDDKSQSQEASNKVQQLIDRDHVIALLGEVASSRSIAGGLIANTKKIPMVTPSSTAVSVTKDREYVFRACFTDDQQGDVAARFAVESLKKKSIGLLYAAQDSYSSGLARSFKERAQKLGATIIVEKAYQSNETQFSTLLSELKAAKPDLVFVPVYYKDMVQIARQAKQLDMPGALFMGSDGWDSADLIEGAGDILEGAYLTNLYAPDVPWPNSQQFLTAFRAKYKHDPSSNSAQGYDAAKLLFDAISRATEVTPEAIKTALAQTKDFVGATGTITIDKDHNANKPIVIAQVKGKKFTYSSQMSSQ
jgi:branched-chain amino acid transport system substrate-binding protein